MGDLNGELGGEERRLPVMRFLLYICVGGLSEVVRGRSMWVCSKLSYVCLWRLDSVRASLRGLISDASDRHFFTPAV